jgi:type II secretory pathway component GspD/PulD (secretin)
MRYHLYYAQAFRAGLLAAGLILTPPAAAQDRLTWQEQLFERTSVEEDIRDVFRALLRQNDTQVVFRPGVDGKVSFQFSNMPLQAAFNKLMEENGLDYNYDARTRTATLFKTASTERQEQLLALSFINVDRLRSVAATLRLGGELIADEQTRMVLARGTPDQVRRLIDLGERLDRAEGDRLKRIGDEREAEAKRLEAEANQLRALAQQQDSQSSAVTRRLEAEAKAKEIEAKAREVELRQRMIDNILNTEIRVIPLRYASVGSTSQTFQGQQITIPGVDETLRVLLGLTESKATLAGGAPAPGPGGVPGLSQSARMTEIKAELGLLPPDISIDTRTNSIIVRGSPSAVKQVEDLVKRLDKRLPLIEIEVIIVRAARGVSEELGIRYGGERVNVGTGNVGSAGFNTGIAGDSLVQSTASLTTTTTTATATAPGTNPATTSTTNTGPLTTPVPPISPITLLPALGPGGSVAAFVYRGTNLALQAQLRALSVQNRSQTLSSPRVITLNNLPARVTNDRSRFIPTPSAPNQAGDLKEIKAGLVLNITPSVIEAEVSGEPNIIRLNLNASDKDVSLAAGGQAAVTGNEVQTQVEIPDGATFVMGGLFNDLRQEGKDGIPGLQDIPFIGALFQSRTSQNDLSEVIFFITPRVLRSEDLYASDIAQRRYAQGQRALLSEMRRDIQIRSQLLNLNSMVLEEDE